MGLLVIPHKIEGNFFVWSHMADLLFNSEVVSPIALQQGGHGFILNLLLMLGWASLDSFLTVLKHALDTVLVHSVSFLPFCPLTTGNLTLIEEAYMDRCANW